MFEEHCQECSQVLGHRCEKVHRWLDEFFWKLGPAHRKLRHHKDGVERVRQLWGDLAASAAELHIRSDFPGLNDIPDADDYVTGKLGIKWEIAIQEAERARREAKRRGRHDK